MTQWSTMQHNTVQQYNKIHYMRMFDPGQNQVHNSLLVQIGNLYTHLKGS